VYLVNCVCENIYKGYDDLRLKEKADVRASGRSP